MTTHADVLRNMLLAFKSGNYAEGERYLHDDLVIDEPHSLPQGGIFRGRDASRRVKEIIRAHWEQQMGELELYESGEIVISRRPIVWTSTKTGKSAECTAVEFFEFRDGKVVSITVYLRDTAQLLATLD